MEGDPTGMYGGEVLEVDQRINWVSEDQTVEEFK